MVVAPNWVFDIFLIPAIVFIIMVALSSHSLPNVRSATTKPNKVLASLKSETKFQRLNKSFGHLQTLSSVSYPLLISSIIIIISLSWQPSPGPGTLGFSIYKLSRSMTHCRKSGQSCNFHRRDPSSEVPRNPSAPHAASWSIGVGPDAKIVSLCQYHSSALPQYTVMWFGIKMLIFDIKGEDKRRKTMHLVSV